MIELRDRTGRRITAATFRRLHPNEAFIGDVPPPRIRKAYGLEVEITAPPDPEAAASRAAENDARRANGLDPASRASTLLMVDLWLFMTTGKTPHEATDQEFADAERAVEGRLLHHARSERTRRGSPRARGGAGGPGNSGGNGPGNSGGRQP